MIPCISLSAGLALFTGLEGGILKATGLSISWQHTNMNEQLMSPEKGHAKDVRGLRTFVFSPAGHHLASGSDDRLVRLWRY